ncbi:MAG: GspE/PulE family protein, partial [Gammaproteobacteria bacterium]|nr:GspE/PulE family protein [Gammaproteobacteria bacterium]
MMQEARLTQLIIEGGLVRADQLEIAQQESRKTETPLAQVLIDSGFVERHQLRDIYAGEMSMPSVSLQNLVPDSVALSLLSAERARTLCVFPLNADPDTKLLRLAVAERIDLLVQDTIQNQIPRDWAVTFCLATEHEILAAIDRFYGVELSIDGILTELDTSPEEEGSAAPPMVYTQPVVRLVDAILVDALRRLASDIHFEPEQNFVRIRYRIDGVLQNVRSLHKDHWPSMLVRIKVMCALNITETRAPQDGHLRLMLEGRNVDFRAATFPVLGGECVVIRILDRPASFLQLESLGIAAEQFNQLVSLLERPQGLLLVTGPTGSGKTTTLYSMLNQMAGEERNIVTMEDPVEYVLPMIRQCSVNNAPKLDFAGGVRAMLRQDPDVILVGETRDQETAEMVLRAALTGHLVLTTLH